MSRFLIRNIRRRTIAIVLGVVTCAAVYSLAARTPPELPRFSEPPPELQPTAGQNMRVDLLTIDAGVEFYSVWGHTALRIYDARSGRDVVFDFGMFMPDELFLLKFLHNQPAYLLWVSSFDETRYTYARLNRTVRTQQIHLTDAEADALLRKLAINSLPQNRVYRYHHYYNNCTTKLRDILDEDFFGGRLREIYSKQYNDTSFRPLAGDLLTHDPAYWLAINLIQGTLVDRPVNAWEEMFLPDKLMYYLDEYRQRHDGADRIGPIQLVQAAPRPLAERSVFRPWAIFTVVYVALLAFLYVWPLLSPGSRAARTIGNFARFAWYIGAGFAGLILSILWFYAEQDSLDNNINLLAYSPLLLLMPLAHFWLRNPARRELYLKLHLFFAAWPALGILLVITTIHPQLSGVIFLVPSLLIHLAIYYFLKRRDA